MTPLSRGHAFRDHALWWAGDPSHKDKGLQLEFTVKDEGAFTTVWVGDRNLSVRLARFWAENPQKTG